MSAFDRIRSGLGRGRAPPPLACNELVELITDYLEDALPATDRARFDAHLEGCDGCRAYLEQMRRTSNLAGRLHEEAIPPEASERMLQALRAWNGR